MQKTVYFFTKKGEREGRVIKNNEAKTQGIGKKVFTVFNRKKTR